MARFDLSDFEWSVNRSLLPNRPHGRRKKRPADPVEINGRPAHDGRSAADMFDSIKASNIFLADRTYDSNDLRDWLAERGAWGNIRPMPTRLNSPAFSKWLYRQRNAVERFFNKL